MTSEEAKRLQGHWSTKDLALKDAWRVVMHLWNAGTHLECSTCEYAEKRLKELGFVKVPPSDRKATE